MYAFKLRRRVFKKKITLRQDNVLSPNAVNALFIITNS